MALGLEDEQQDLIKNENIVQFCQQAQQAYSHRRLCKLLVCQNGHR